MRIENFNDVQHRLYDEQNGIIRDDLHPIILLN